MTQPLVSVVIPCFNLGAYIDETIQSVLAQTVDDVEILVVDDGSTDPETTRVLDAAQWPRTRIFRTPNHGLARARNFLISQARGEFLCALDADDKLHPEYLERTLAAFAADPGLTFVSTRLQMFGAESRIMPDELRCDLPTLLVDCPIFSAALTRRAAVTRIGGYDEGLLEGDEDWDLWITLLEAGCRGIILPDVLFFYRRRPGSMCVTCSTGETHLNLVRYLVRKHLASYRAHLPHVLLTKRSELHRERMRVAALVRETDEALQPTIARRRAELARLRQILHAHETAHAERAAESAAADRRGGEFAALRLECDRARDEVAALHASVSWRLTSPLRRTYDFVGRILGRSLQ